MQTLLEFLERLHRGWIWLGCVISILALGMLNARLGWEVSFSILYLVPIGVAAWVLGRAPAAGFSVLSAFLWLFANREAPVSADSLIYWNTFVRLLLFLIVSELLAGLRRALNRERDLARKDPLTGLANTLSFNETAQREIAGARRTGRPLSLVWIDLDGFKQINDELGHEAGDRLLGQVGAALRHSTRQTDLPARIGGDEFAILLPETDRDGAHVMVEKIRLNVAEQARIDDRKVSMSIGTVACEQNLPDLDELLRRADQLMYEVKRSGKGTSKIELCASIEPKNGS